jgi:tRNA-2-methylthio-N6-dimethylallyladenosine synthase
MNKNDSAIISHLLCNAGMCEVNSPETADIIVINTCSIRDHAEQRALGHIATLRSWREQQGTVLAVVGCMAQRSFSKLTSEYPYIDLILGPDTYRNIARHVTDLLETRTRLTDTTFSDQLYCGIYPVPGKISDFVSIMRGCSNYCSYCVVPYVRGPARSRAASDILAQLSFLIKHGVKDITLLGQNVNEYQHENIDFARLLEQVTRIKGVCRIRFLTSHPKDLNERTIRLIAQQPVLCEWFHLPLQSASDRILELMNRQYTIEQYKTIVAQIRNHIPDATITTDIIVGFPTESDQEYQETIEVIKELQFDDAYMYRYSSRPDTAAVQYENLPEDVTKHRLENLITIQTGITQKRVQSMINKKYEVLFEEPAKQGGTRGRTRGNRDIIVRSDIPPGSIHTVEVVEVKGRTPIGTIPA